MDGVHGSSGNWDYCSGNREELKLRHRVFCGLKDFRGYIGEKFTLSEDSRKFLRGIDFGAAANGVIGDTVVGGGGGLRHATGWVESHQDFYLMYPQCGNRGHRENPDLNRDCDDAYKSFYPKSEVDERGFEYEDSPEHVSYGHEENKDVLVPKELETKDPAETSKFKRFWKRISDASYAVSQNS